MSYYSGFQNRQQLQQYEQLLQLLIVTISKRLVKFYQNEDCDEQAFRNIFQRIVSGLKSLESTKFMPPRFAETVKPLIDILKLEEQQESDRLFKNTGFDVISKQANLIINQEKKMIPHIQYKIKEDPQDMPPHPLLQMEQKSNHSKFEAVYEKLDKQDRVFKLEQIDKKQKNDQITETATPRKLSENPVQQQQYNILPKEFINQIEECVTRNVLDKLNFSRRSKKKKQKSSSNSFQFRQQLLLTTTEKQNSSFQSTQRKFNFQ